MPPHPEPSDNSVADRAAESKAQPTATPAVSTPAARTPADRKPAVRTPAVRKPAVRTTTAAKPTAAKPTAAKPTAAKPTAAKPTTEAGVTTPAVRKPAVRKPAVRKPAAPKSTGPKQPAATASSASTPPVVAKATARVLAEQATDETTRPYATRDALVVTRAGTKIGPSPEPAGAPAATPKIGSSAAAEPVTQPEADAAPVVVAAVVAAPVVVAPVLRTPAVLAPIVIEARGLVKRFGHNVAVANLDLTVRAGSFYGIVGPNGAGKTTTLSMITGLLRPTAGTVMVHGIDVWARPNEAKRVIGVLPDRLRLFDRLTGAQLLYYAGTLRGLDNDTVRSRSTDLAAAFGLEDALNRLVADYSAGMTKKIALACAMIHSPRVLVLDEPFESVDPVSAVNVTEILQKYVAAGGTVVLSSHGMDLIQRVCDHVAIIVQGRVLAAGTIDEVRGQKTLEDRFVELAGGRKVAEGMEWLHNFSD